MKTDKNYAVLVYQSGIANVFAVDCLNVADFGRNARLLMQRDFWSCEMFARGLAYAGYKVAIASCNQAGNIATSRWTEGLEDCPFRDSARPSRSWDTPNWYGAQSDMRSEPVRE